MKKVLSLTCAIAAPLLFSQTAMAQIDFLKFLDTDGSHKRFSVSAGWLHAKTEDKPTPLQNSTSIYNGYQSGPAQIYGLQEWSSPRTGLTSDNVNTAGMLFTTYIDDHWSVEMKAGIPPKVDILGKGFVQAPGHAFVGGNMLPATTDVTHMAQGNGVASTARAWLPAALVQYQFGKSGVNKFRPYVGVGMMYAYFSDIKLNRGIGQDLSVAAGRIQLIEDGNPIAALGSKEDVMKAVNTGAMSVKVSGSSAVAPIINLGATYDIDDRWYAVGSVSYAKLDNDTTISVRNAEGKELIYSKANIDIDPIITYLGLGYRF
ncbi:OmpW/AlkL family protein [Psychrobacter lutiphocae]|uniref:OmpW/AlkL family protein n=1 Tax=Psychrobacter lutiphocae TaxID=540500 RepID=UPI000373B6EB|nr:OmpW family outer membrane protein [Psychrobacter lutiphocae]